jgi:hypothetical protein
VTIEENPELPAHPLVPVALPTLSAPCERLPFNNLRNARSRLAPLGASGTTIVNSDTLPKRLPMRPELSTGGGNYEPAT